MKYIEWRDELSGYLVDLPDDERQKILSYFAEMYADKREAGLKESEIISEFGAPYDVARRVLNERYDEADEDEEITPERRHREPKRKRNAEREEKEQRRKHCDDPQPSDGGTAIFVILCIIFAVPLFSLLCAMVTVSVAFCIAPAAAFIGSLVTIIAGIVSLCATGAGITTLGAGIIALGASCLLTPIFTGLVKLMWKAFAAVFGAIRRAVTGRA
ncbi:MAG: DUF1700 domain-containing protein [Candidatus Coproplasma sp.]